MQLSGRENTICNNLIWKKKQRSVNEKSTHQKLPWTKSVSRDEKINLQASRRENSTNNRIHEQESARNKFQEPKTRNRFHEQNQFHEEKNPRTSFTKRNIKMPEVSRTKISKQQVPWTKYVSGEEKSMYKFSQWEKINMEEVSRKNKSASQKFRELKINRQEVPWTKSVSRGEK